jgi:hypothetical protein
MSAGSGNGGTNGAEGAPRPSLEEVLASIGEPKDPGTRLAIFVGQQTIDIGRMIETQTRGMSDMMRLLAEQLSALMLEVAALRAQRAAEERGSLQ